MPRKEKTYKRLSHKGSSSFSIATSSKSSLWTAKDHLLYVEKEAYSEHYKRFPLKDIQAIITRKTIEGTLTTILLSTLGSAFLLMLLYGRDNEWPTEAITTMGVLATILIIPMLINILKGPTAAFYIRTAVQTVQIKSIKRLNNAVKLTKTLKENIENIQGQLADEHITRMKEDILEQEEDAKRRTEEAEAAIKKRKRPQPELKPYKSKSHKILFAFLLADFAHNCIQFLVNDPNMYFVAVFITLGIAGSTIIALIKQFNTRLWRSVKGITWATLGYLIVTGTISSIHLTIYSTMHLSMHKSSLQMYREIYATSPFDSMFRMSILIIGIISTSTIGLTGLIFFNRFRKSQSEQPPTTRQESSAT